MIFPRGFHALGARCGIKKKNAKDLALFYSSRPCDAAGIFTKNLFCAAPVTVSKSRVGGKCRAITANAGNANACTGAKGVRDALEVCRGTATALGIKPREVLIASTGVIGKYLPMAKIRRGVKELAGRAAAAGNDPVSAAKAVMTTDTFHKIAAARVRVGGKNASIWACAKGSGMIAPDMATMLSFILTDAAVERGALDAALRRSAATTFNRLTVDGDTSTNDTVLILANGAAQNRPVKMSTSDWRAFASALEGVCLRLTEMLASDGEGATKLVSVEVRGARSAADARRAAKAVAESPLVKTAVYGRDANWGRVVAALGRSGAALAPRRVDVGFGGITVFRRGAPVKFSEAAAKRILSAKRVEIVAGLGVGAASARYFTCDLSQEYIRINADYRT